MPIVVAVLHAQGVGVGNITGVTVDSSGAIMANVRLEAKNASTGVTVGTVSNAAGNYQIPNLIPGDYVLSADAAGFKKYVRSGLIVQVGQTVRADVQMELGNVTEVVDVRSAAPLVQTESGSLGNVIDNQKVAQIPLNGRNVFNLVNLVPGAAPDNSGRTRINGSRARSNEYMVDGVTQVIPETRADQVPPPPIDSVEEFKVLTNSYSAEYGDSSGGLVNVASKSGNNQYHGTLWEFLRNDKLNTRNFFASPTAAKPVLRQNQFGVAGGGPVVIPKVYDGHNRTFFFADYEGRRVRSQQVFNVTVPTAALRAGNFGSFLGGNLGADAAGRGVLQGQVYDPGTQRSENGQTIRDPFPNNIVPSARFDPVAVKLLDYWPAPTSASLTQNFLRANPTGNNYNRFDIRGDHEINSKNRAFARFSSDKTETLPSVAFRGSSGDTESNVRVKTLTSSWTSTVSPSKLNELRFSILNWVRKVSPYRADENVAQLVGIANITTKSGVPNMDISNIQGIGNIFSGGFNNGTDWVYSFIDHFSIITGVHTIKFGGSLRVYRLKNFQPSVLNGNFTFRSSQTSLPGSFSANTGNAFASFLLGVANSTQYTQKDPGQEVNNQAYGWFVQDDIKLSRRLTVNLGLRYELNTVLHDAHGNDSTFDLVSGRVLAGPARPDPPLDRNNIAPRVGFAFDLSGKQTTVVRGGFGIFYQPTQGGGGNPLAGVVKFPFEFTSNAVSPNGIDSVTTLSRGPILQQEYNLNDPRLGFGTTVQLQQPNLAPYVEQWNFGVEHSLRLLGGDTLFGAAYVGSGGRKLEGGRTGYLNINQVPIGIAQQAGKDQNTTNPNTAGLKPYPNFNQVQPLLPRYGNSNYNSLQLKMERRLAGGVNFLIAYTFAKSIDNDAETFNFSGGSWPQDVYNLRSERSVSTADVPRRIVASWVWDLPFGAGRRYKLNRLVNAFAGGWQISGIASAANGRPVDVEQSTNTSGTFSLLQRPNISGNPLLSGDQRNLNRFFDTSKFSAATPLQFGSSPRNPVRGPGLTNFDAAINKQWAFQEKRAVEFRCEMFNFTNTPPLSLETRTSYNPSLPLDRQTFGRLTSAGDGRVLQFALKLRL